MRSLGRAADVIVSSSTVRSSLCCRAAILLLVSVVCAGCGQDSGGRLEISGKVQFQGSSLASGTIEFVSADGAQRSGATIDGGTYSIPAPKGLQPGKYIVRINSAQETGPAPTGPPGPESMTQVAQNLIPPQYNVNSTLTAEVTESGDNEFDFDLK
jgi:hypothetical protein